jgi:hypothetical protein
LGCEDCHSMSEAGQKRFNAGPYVPSKSAEGRKKGH